MQMPASGASFSLDNFHILNCYFFQYFVGTDKFPNVRTKLRESIMGGGGGGRQFPLPAIYASVCQEKINIYI